MFTLEIELGNAAMGTPEDVADALKKIASKLQLGQTEGKVRDDNGNTVGKFSGDFPEAEEEDGYG